MHTLLKEAKMILDFSFFTTHAFFYSQQFQ